MFFFLENVKMGDNERFQESIFALKITTMQISQIHKFHLEQSALTIQAEAVQFLNLTTNQAA